MRFFRNLFFLFLFTVLFSCKEDKIIIPDVSHIDPKLELIRFEQYVLSLDLDNLEAASRELKQRFPAFYEVYFQQIMADRPLKEDEIPLLIREILEEEYLYKIADTVEVLFGDFNTHFQALEALLQRYRYYFQDDRPKTLMTFISEFGVGACTIGEDTLGLGLDLYLGEDFEGYDPTVFPAFIRMAMQADYIPIHMGKVLIQNNIPGMANNRMLDIMMYHGKMLYVLRRLLPYTPAYMLMEYKPEQMEWVEANELQIWSHFLSSDLLYSTRKQDFQKLVGPSPNAPNMPSEAPGQTANWIGWQIVEAFMKRYPDTSIPELLQMQDAQELLEKSRYRPR